MLSVHKKTQQHLSGLATVTVIFIHLCLMLYVLSILLRVFHCFVVCKFYSVFSPPPIDVIICPFLFDIEHRRCDGSAELNVNSDNDVETKTTVSADDGNILGCIENPITPNTGHW